MRPKTGKPSLIQKVQERQRIAKEKEHNKRTQEVAVVLNKIIDSLESSEAKERLKEVFTNEDLLRLIAQQVPAQIYIKALCM